MSGVELTCYIRNIEGIYFISAGEKRKYNLNYLSETLKIKEYTDDAKTKQFKK